MELKLVKVENPDELNFILGQSHFIKTVEDLHEAIVSTVPNVKFGLAFCEASGERLIRHSGTDDNLVELAKQNAMNLSSGHSFIIFLKDAFPINILRVIKSVPEIVTIFCATSNPTEVVVAETNKGNGIMGVIDGGSPKGHESKKDIKGRKEFLRKIGYKF